MTWNPRSELPAVHRPTHREVPTVWTKVPSPSKDNVCLGPGRLHTYCPSRSAEVRWPGSALHANAAHIKNTERPPQTRRTLIFHSRSATHEDPDMVSIRTMLRTV